MKKVIRNILLVILFLHLQAYAIIFESGSLKDIYKHVDQETVVVFDIDHTVVENSIDLDTWIAYKITDLRKKGLEIKDAVHLILNVYYTLQHFIDFYPIGGSKNIIADLQSKKVSVVALTNRSIPILRRTVEQMKNIDIDFSVTSLYDEDLGLSVTHIGKFSKGILFSGPNDKGKMLFAFFDKIGYKPKKIIFIDDKLKYVKSVEREAKKRNIEFVGIRFSLQDKKKKNFDFNQVEKELHELKIQIGMEPLQR